jgi:hypothetical protein
MSFEWYQLAPVILTDALWAEYAPPCFTSGSVGQRRAAFLKAEQQMVEQLNTPLVPTQVTGTYGWRPRQILDFVRVSSIDAVSAKSVECSCVMHDISACAILLDAKHGIADLWLTGNLLAACGCGAGSPYLAEVVFTAGLPTGTSSLDMGLHMALAMAATLVLNEIVDPGANEGGPGDPGVVSFGSQGYSEQRISPTSFAGLRKTPFGTSARANKIADLVSHLKVNIPMRLP